MLDPLENISFIYAREWRDHVQAGVCPTSRRGHTATLVIDRRVVEPVKEALQQQKTDAAGHARSANTVDGGGGPSGGGGAEGNNNQSSPGRTSNNQNSPRRKHNGDGEITQQSQ